MEQSIYSKKSQAQTENRHIKKNLLFLDKVVCNFSDLTRYVDDEKKNHNLR